MSSDSDQRRGPVSAEGMAKHILLRRVIQLASQPWLNPNERCACVTIALALVVCPDAVEIDGFVSTMARFRYIEIRMPGEGGGRGNFSTDFLGTSPVDLAVFPADSENNRQATEILLLYPNCESNEQRAAVLGLAWVCLVMGFREVNFAAAVDGGFVIENHDFGLYVKHDRKGRVVEACFRPPPGLMSAKPDDWRRRIQPIGASA